LNSENRVPATVWVGVILLRSFSHELWRALCIVGLINLGVPKWPAVLITAIAYGSLQLYKNKARFLGVTFYGCVAGFLFVRADSLLAPLTMTLITAAGHFYQVRYVRWRDRKHIPTFTCPTCSQVIEEMERPRMGQFVCPKCGEKLKFKLPTWPLFVFGIVAAALALFLSGANAILWLILFLPLLCILGILSGIVMGIFAPEINRVVADRSPFDFRLFRS
jgi:hypothetical protein